MNKKITSVVLALCMMMSCFAFGTLTTQAKTTDTDAVSANAGTSVAAENETEAIQGGTILQCFNQSYNGIKNNMKTIAEQGFTAVVSFRIE